MSETVAPMGASRRLQIAGRGLRGFLAWWGASLADWLPPRWRHALRARDDGLVLQVSGDELQLRRQSDGVLLDVAVMPVPPSRGDGVDPLGEVLTGAAAELPRRLLLPAADGLRRPLLLPAAAAERMHEVLGFEIERQTPFAREDVLYAGRVLCVRDDGQLQAELVVVPKTRFDAAAGPLGAVATWLSGADLADADGRPLGVNLLPPAQRFRRADPWRMWNLMLAMVAVLALLLGLAQVLANRIAAADALAAGVAERSSQARAVSEQRQRLVDAVEGGAYLQQQRNARPSVIEVIDELARRLPDGTYFEKVAIEGGQLTLIGLSNQAAALVGKLEGAKQWRAPALSGALQPDPRTREDRFTLVAQLADGASKERADAPATR